MPGQRHVARLARQSCFGKVADGAPQYFGRLPLHEDGFQREARNFHLADHVAFRHDARPLHRAHVIESRFLDRLIRLRIHHDVGGVPESANTTRQKKIIGYTKEQPAPFPRPAGDGAARVHNAPFAGAAGEDFPSAAK